MAKDIAKMLISKLAIAYGVTEKKEIEPENALKLLIAEKRFSGDAFFREGGDNDAIDWSVVYDTIFSQHYCSPKEVHKVFSEIFEEKDKAINWTHICLGELVRLGYISTVLTTNFDQLALEGIARTGRLPIVADGLEYLGRITGDSLVPQLIQIHGSRHTYHLRNSIEDTADLSNDPSARHAIDEIFRTARIFVAVGYGGREKGIMELLIEAGKRYPDTRIYWCSRGDELSEISNYTLKLLSTSRFSKIISGYDSDSFFDMLLNNLGIEAPKVIGDPLYILRELAENISYSEQSAIAKKIVKLQDKTADLRVAEAHMSVLVPKETSSTKQDVFQSQKMEALGTLASGIARDFNNVLREIVKSTDGLILQTHSSSESFPDLMEIKRNANRGAVLTRQIMAFSRGQSMNLTVLNLNDIIGDLKMLIDRLVSTSVKINLDYERSLWLVKADLSQVEQVLVNLCVNARDAMPDGGVITIRTRNVEMAKIEDFKPHDLPPQDFVMVEVQDTGTGIAPENLDKIFEPFFTTKEVGKGTGLGLAMCYGIVRQSGGFIYPETEVGKGTNFKFFLPRFIPDEEASGHLEPAASEHELSTKQARVLLVEGEEAVRRGAKRMLEASGYAVFEAGDGMEAMSVINELGGDIDVVVTESILRGMDGPKLLREAREIYPDIEFIFASGYAEDIVTRSLPENARFSFLPKPFSLKQLASAVSSSLGGSR